MYRPIVRLNTCICEVCNRKFKSEKALKDHIFHPKVNDKNHIMFKEELRKKRFKKAKLTCPVCDQKIFRIIKTHFYHSKDENHINFLVSQQRFFLFKFLEGYSAIDISNLDTSYANSFSDKYVVSILKKLVGSKKYFEISKLIMSKRRKNYWKEFSFDERKEIMDKVLDAQWKNLNAEQRKNHPWVLAGRKASLESAKKGSKNQKHAYDQLVIELPNYDWKYNYVLDGNWQVDIAEPNRGIFIEWDGRPHRIPIYGEASLRNRKNRDKLKNRLILEKFNGLMIRVKDEGRENLKFVKQKIVEIKDIIDTKMEFCEVVYI